MDVNAARKAESAGDLRLAIEIWQTLAEAGNVHEKNLTAYLNLTRLCLRTETFELAEEWSARGLEHFPKNALLLFRLGVAASRLQKWEVALQRFRKMTVDYPSNEQGLLGICNCLAELGRYEEADLSYVELIAQHPDFLPALRGYAWLAMRRNRDHEAIRRYYRVLQYNNEDFPSLHALAVIHRRLGDAHRSQAMYRYLIDLYPERPEGHIGVAEYTQVTRDVEHAVSCWRSANSRFPASVIPYLRLGHCLTEADRHDEAEECIEEACGLFTSDHRPLALRARLALARHEYDTAQSCWEEIRIHFADNATALIDYAQYFRQCGGKSLETLIATLESALGSEPDNQQARILLAEAYFDAGRMTESRDILSVVHSGAPTLAFVMILLARAEAALGNPDKAIGLLLKLTESPIPHDKIHAFTALAHLRLRSFDTECAKQALRGIESIMEDDRVTELHRRMQRTTAYFVREYESDAAALRQSRHLVNTNEKMPPESFLRSLITLTSRHADYLPLSLQAAHRLYEHGFYEKYRAIRPGSDDTECRIPRRIVQFWDTRDIPTDIQKAMQTWRNQYPDWEYLLYDDSRVLKFLEEHFDANVVDTYHTCNHPAMKSDFFRHTFMYVFGGMYVDADEVCLQRIEIPASVGLALRFSYRSDISEFLPAFYASCARSPMLRNLVDDMVYRVSNQLDDDHWFSVGPGLFTKHVVSHLAQIGILEDTTENEEVLILMETQYRQHAFTPEFAYKRTDLNWLNVRHGV